MSHDTLRRLAEADPAGELDPAPRADLLLQILELPHPRASHERRAGLARRRVVGLGLALAGAAGLAVAGLLIDPGGSRPLDLAAQAYAQTSAPAGEIVHTLVDLRTTGTLAGSGDMGPTTGTIEEWHRGAETHRLETYLTSGGTRSSLDHVIGADGVMRQVTSDGGYRIVRPSDNEDAAGTIAQQQSGFIAEFRRSYEQGELDPAGDTEFAGKLARRYVVAPAASPGPPGPEMAFYIDRETGAPLGLTSTLETTSTVDGVPRATTMRYVQTVRTIERLAPTPENLDKLRTLSLPRRRDADGCIRGPVTNARPSDAASRRDCGGTPGAPLPGQPALRPPGRAASAP